MRYTIIVLGAPYASNSPWSALNFANAVLTNGHEIYRLFFFSEAVHTANALSSPPRNELDINAAWQTFIKTHNLDSVVCIASALRRGVMNKSEAQRHEKDAFNLLDGHDLSGLGQLIEASISSDKVITFGH